MDGSTDWRYIRLYENANDVVQNSLAISISYDSYAPSLNTEVIVKFSKNAVKAFKTLSALNSLTLTNFNHY